MSGFCKQKRKNPTSNKRDCKRYPSTYQQKKNKERKTIRPHSRYNKTKEYDDGQLQHTWEKILCFCSCCSCQTLFANLRLFGWSENQTKQKKIRNSPLKNVQKKRLTDACVSESVYACLCTREWLFHVYNYCSLQWFEQIQSHRLPLSQSPCSLFMKCNFI